MRRLREWVAAISAMLGLFAVFLSLQLNAIQGTQMAVLGACLLLFALYVRPSDK